MSKLQQSQRLGETVWNKMPKVNAELFTLTYGALVSQLIQDLEDVNLINAKLESMGHNIGVRIIDEYLAKSGTSSCGSFKETAEMIAKVGFKMFLGITAEVTNWTESPPPPPSSSSTAPAPSASSSSTVGTGFSLILNDNPLTEFVELPPQYATLCYSNVLCGVIKGALEMIQLQVDCRFVKDVLKGDEITEMRVELRGVMANTMSEEYTRES